MRALIMAAALLLAAALADDGAAACDAESALPWIPCEQRPVALFFGPPEWLQEPFYKPLADAFAERGFKIEVAYIPCRGELGCWRRRAETDPQWAEPAIEVVGKQVSGRHVIGIASSRAAFFALAAARRHPGLHAVIALSPVIDLTALDEFRGFTNPQHVETNLAAAPGGLVDRSVFIAIGSDDRRVGTAHALQLAAALHDLTLYVAPSEGHRTPSGTQALLLEWVAHH